MSESVAAYSLGVFLVGLSGFVFENIRYLGFPDGFYSELDRGEKILFQAFLYFCIPAGLGALYLGWVAARRKISRELRFVGILSAIGIALFFMVDIYLRFHLIGGGG